MDIVATSMPMPRSYVHLRGLLDEEIMRSDQVYMAEYGIDALIVMQEVRRTVNEHVERAVIGG